MLIVEFLMSLEEKFNISIGEVRAKNISTFKMLLIIVRRWRMHQPRPIASFNQTYISQKSLS